MTLNKALLEKVRKLITEDPRRLNMSTWGSKENSEAAKRNSITEFPECGTVACLAGWTLLANAGDQKAWGKKFDADGYLKSSIGVPIQAAKLLGISEDEAHNVFLNTHWGKKQVIRWIDRKLKSN